jgi:transcriptional regulator with XRE-family HTH domain
MDNEDVGYLAERLRWLFDEVRRPDGRPYSLRDVAAGVNAVAGQELMSFQYLALLCSGKRRNPSFMMVAALARWFGVDTGYFSPFAWVVPRRCNSALEPGQHLVG